MKINDFGQTILTTEEALTALLSGSEIDQDWIVEDVDEVSSFNNRQDYFHEEPHLFFESQINEDATSYLQERAKNWLLPEEYTQLDIEEYILSKASPDQLDRVTYELIHFKKHGLYPILRLMKYLVDNKQSTDIWGVGRGSSVASLCLFLIGIHKIDPLKYDLDFHEFLDDK